MAMEREELMRIAADAVNESELKSAEIPPIDLYVDQIINLVSEKLKHGSERYHDRHLTKTMINNYSKDGIITQVKGKKYSKEQIVQMLTVYTLKSSLSIGEIKRLMGGAYASEDFSGEDLTAIYDRHIDIKEEGKSYALKILDELVERNELDLCSDGDYITAVCALAALSNQLRNISQAMIDARFPEPVEDEEEKEKEDKPSEKALEKEKAKMEKSAEKAKKKEAKKKKASDEAEGSEE